MRIDLHTDDHPQDHGSAIAASILAAIPEEPSSWGVAVVSLNQWPEVRLRTSGEHWDVDLRVRFRSHLATLEGGVEANVSSRLHSSGGANIPPTLIQGYINALQAAHEVVSRVDTTTTWSHEDWSAQAETWSFGECTRLGIEREK